jgi:hypothetical protein
VLTRERDFLEPDELLFDFHLFLKELFALCRDQQQLRRVKRYLQLYMRQFGRTDEDIYDAKLLSYYVRLLTSENDTQQYDGPQCENDDNNNTFASFFEGVLRASTTSQS